MWPLFHLQLKITTRKSCWPKLQILSSHPHPWLSLVSPSARISAVPCGCSNKSQMIFQFPLMPSTKYAGWSVYKVWQNGSFPDSNPSMAFQENLYFFLWLAGHRSSQLISSHFIPEMALGPSTCKTNSVPLWKYFPSFKALPRIKRRQLPWHSCLSSELTSWDSHQASPMLISLSLTSISPSAISITALLGISSHV